MLSNTYIFFKLELINYKTFIINILTFRFCLNEAHTNIEAMSHLSDHILYDIQYSHDPNLEEAKSLLNRLLTRHLYKFVGSFNLLFVSIVSNNITFLFIFNQYFCFENLPKLIIICHRKIIQLATKLLLYWIYYYFDVVFYYAITL